MAPIRIPRLTQPRLAVDHARVDGHRLAVQVILLEEVGVVHVAVEQHVHKVGEGNFAAFLLIGARVKLPFKMVSARSDY